jgi:hypothetical protein
MKFLKRNKNTHQLCVFQLVLTHHEILIVCKTYIPDEAAALSTSSVPVKRRTKYHSLQHYAKR